MVEEDLKIEVLFPETANLYGDTHNMVYLKQCLPKAEFIETGLADEPYFANNDVNMIYMGSMKESTQERVIEKLSKYRRRIIELIKKNVVFLMTGNAMEVFEKYIETDDGTQIKALNIFDLYAKRTMMNRYHEMQIGEFKENLDIVGYKASFSMSYGDNSEGYFMKVVRGRGINDECEFEGIRQNNFFGTYYIGPLLILNPLFTKYLIKLLGIKGKKLAFEETAIEAYELKLNEFSDPKREG